MPEKKTLAQQEKDQNQEQEKDQNQEPKKNADGFVPGQLMTSEDMALYTKNKASKIKEGFIKNFEASRATADKKE